MTDLIIRDVQVLDCTGRDPDGRSDVVIRDGRIAEIRSVRGARVSSRAGTIDGAGCTLMPGLTDAHVHFALIGDDGDSGSDPLVVHVLRVAEIIGRALDEGFTTVRDAGGLEPVWADVVASGRIRGPRILPSGSFISQTGGHADHRAQHEAVHHGVSIPGLVARPEVVDGADAVRRAVREQLRRGATQVKLHASGGIRSPSDPYDSVQLSRDEIAAAVDVARSWGTYVLAHCLTSPAVENALEAGVRSIEHATFLEQATADKMSARGAYMVPTLFAFKRLAGNPAVLNVAASKRRSLDLDEVVRASQQSIEMADAAGVRLGSGSDIVGPDQGGGAREIVSLAELLGAHKAIISATRTNAALFRLESEIGTVEVGKHADLILVKGQPLDDVQLLTDARSIPIVVKGGVVAKDSEARLS